MGNCCQKSQRQQNKTKQKQQQNKTNKQKHQKQQTTKITKREMGGWGYKKQITNEWSSDVIIIIDLRETERERVKACTSLLVS